MAESSYFFNSAARDKRTYQAADFAKYFASVLSSGIMPNPERVGSTEAGEYGLKVASYINTMDTSVSGGHAIIKGHRYEVTWDGVRLTHRPSQVAAYDRIDRVVLRLDLRATARYVKAFVIEGEESYNPQPPSLTRNASVYEISLAQVRIRGGRAYVNASDILDERANEAVCGFTNSLITVPTSVFQQQFDAWFENYQTSAGEDFRNWTEYQKLDVATWVNHFKDEVMDANDEYQTWVENLKSTTSADTTTWQNSRKAQFDAWQNVEQRDFNNWVEGLKDNLGEAVAEDIKLEVEAARVDGETGEAFETVPQRLDNVSEKLIESAKARQLIGITQKSYQDTNKKAFVVFATDDANIHDYNVFRDFFAGYNAPWCTAVIPTRVGTTGYCNVAQLRILVEQFDVELWSHTNTHQQTSTLSDVEIDNEMRLSKDWFIENGFTAEIVAYPFGNYDDRVKNAAKKYYRAARCSDPGYNTYPLASHELQGLWIGSDVSGYPAYNGYPVNTIEHYTSAIDQAKETGGIVIISFHSWQLGSSNSPTDDNIRENVFRPVIEYALANATVTTLSNALNQVGNVLEVGTPSKKTTDGAEFLAVGYDGSVLSNRMRTKYMPFNSYDGNSKYTEYEEYTTTINQVGAAKAIETNLPMGAAGTLEAHCHADPKVALTYNYRLYHPVNSEFVFKQNLRASTGEWMNWFPIGRDNIPDSVDLSASITSYNLGETRTKIEASNAIALGLPIAANGEVYTYKHSATVNTWNYQIFKTANGLKFKRTPNSSNVWSNWFAYGDTVPNRFNFDTPITDYPLGTHDIKVSQAQAANMPEGLGGILTVKKVDATDNTWNYAEYLILSNGNKYRRKFSANGVAQTWTLISTVTG